MSKPNRTVAAERGRKLTRIAEVVGLRTEAEVDAAKAKLAAENPGAIVRSSSYRVGPALSHARRGPIRPPATRYAVRAYRREP